MLLFAMSAEAWVGAIAIPIALAVIGLLITLASQQSGTNARLDGIKGSLDSHGNKLDDHEKRIDAVEMKQVRHDIYWETARSGDQRQPEVTGNRDRVSPNGVGREDEVQG